MNFRYRLILFLVVTLTAVQLLTALSAYAYLHNNLIEKAKRDLTAAAGIFTRQFDILSERTSSEVEVLSLDYALRTAIAQRDIATELSALRNHGRRVGATRMMLVDLSGTISADTGSSSAVGRSFPHPEILSDAVEQGDRATFILLGGRVYWMTVVPVRAPVPIAFIAAYIPVDNALLENLKNLSSVARSVELVSQDARGRWTIANRTREAPGAIPAPQDIRSRPETVVDRDGQEYLTIATLLPTPAHSAPIYAILGYPMADAFAAYRSIIGPVLMVLTLALLVAGACAFTVVRYASRPLEALAASARRIAEGDYTVAEPLRQNDEIGQLSQALSGMTQSIAEREAALNSAIDALEISRREAVTANEAKSHFLANMSHELRTPLNAILGFAEMMQQEVLGPLGAPRYRDYARDIVTSGQRLLNLVSRLLDHSDIEAGRFGIAKESLDIRSLLIEVTESRRDEAENAGVILSLDVERQDRLIEGDSAKLRQAISSVIENAVKFTPKSGHVRISGRVRANAYAVVVEDTGIGMRQEDIALVTRPFHRLRGAFDGKHQGAGLGLPFAKAVVSLHDGALAISSHPGRGTIVEMTFPLLPAAQGVAA